MLPGLSSLPALRRKERRSDARDVNERYWIWFTTDPCVFNHGWTRI